MEEDKNLIQEVKQELSEEKLYTFLATNYKYFILLAALVILALCTRLWYNSYISNKQAHDGSELLRLAVIGSNDQALKALEELSHSSTNYGALAAMELADDALLKNEKVKAQLHLRNIINNKSYDIKIRDIAALKLAGTNLKSEESYKIITDLIERKSFVALSAKELEILHLKYNAKPDYKIKIAELLNDDKTPSSLKLRVSAYQ